MRCGRPWPCKAAKKALGNELTQTRLAMYACAQLIEAAH